MSALKERNTTLSEHLTKDRAQAQKMAATISRLEAEDGRAAARQLEKEKASILDAFHDLVERSGQVKHELDEKTRVLSETSHAEAKLREEVRQLEQAKAAGEAAKVRAARGGGGGQAVFWQCG